MHGDNQREEPILREWTPLILRTLLIVSTAVLVVGLTMISIVVMLAIFFLSGKNDAAKGVNVNVTTPPATPRIWSSRASAPVTSMTATRP